MSAFKELGKSHIPLIRSDLMKEKDCVHRRTFLKMSAAGAAGLSVGGIDPVFATTAAWRQINPAISNSRVVCCYDPKMITASPTSFTFATTNGAVNKTVILKNLDLMAMSLAQKTTADAAWKTIFQMPAGKTSWSQVKVAIKINVINSYNQPRVAIVEKVCRVLNGFGVPAANIIVYDGCAAGKNGGGAQSNLWAPMFSTTDTTKIPGVVSNLNGSLGGTANVTVPNVGSWTCTKQISDGTIDILVNCSVNKGHDKYAGGMTLSMKNHFGTFAPDHNGVVLSNILNFNKSDFIVGGTPPRQQLCIADSLWGDLATNPDSPPDQVLSRLAMGTFGPVLDYLFAQNIRKAIMIVQNKGKDNHDWTAINRFLTDFGYATTDAFQWVDVDPTVGTRPDAVQESSQHGLEIALGPDFAHPSSANFAIPASAGSVKISIHDLLGKTVHEFSRLSLSEKAARLQWNGTSVGGGISPVGVYVVKVSGSGYEQTGRLELVR